MSADDVPFPEHLRFGHFELQHRERKLLEHGQPVALGARAFDLLAVLAAHSGRLVTKDHLLDTVWRGLIVEDNNLQVQVSTLRRLLGADAIATVPGHGYRFMLPTEARGLPAATVGAPVAEAPPPSRLPPMYGRSDALAALETLIEREAVVTLVGPGGVGKTRLAQELAQRRQTARAPEPFAWVDLASLTDGSLLPARIAAALGLALADATTPALIAALKPLRLGLILDNAEHLIEPVAALVHALRRGTDRLRLLVTSQAPLRIEGEVVWRLEGLALAPTDADVPQALTHGAVVCFVEQVRALDRRFVLDSGTLPAVLDVCRRLDGLPLALQLAAARVPGLGVRAVAQRLDARFALLNRGTRDAPGRHVNLHAALDWSHALLSGEEQAVFRRLGVFVGGFGLDAAAGLLEALAPEADRWAAIDVFAALVDRSLVQTDAADPPRYSLTETPRAYALERLAEAGEVPAARAAQAALVERHFEPAPEEWLRSADTEWLARYAPEIDNLRAALLHAREQLAGDGHAVARRRLVALFGAAAPLWLHLALDAEARRWAAEVEPLLAGCERDASLVPLVARAWRSIQWAWAAADPGRSRAAAREAQRLYLELGDAHGQYAQFTGEAGLYAGGDPRARAALDAALALEHASWPARERAWGQRARADVARAEGRLDESRAAREAELALRAEAGDERGRQRALAHLADLALAMGDAPEAVRRGRELLDDLGPRPSATRGTTLLNLMHALLVQGEVDAAADLANEVARLATDFGSLWQAADDLAWLAAERGRLDVALRIAAWADAAHTAREEARSKARWVARSVVDVLTAQARSRATGSVEPPATEADVLALFVRAA